MMVGKIPLPPVAPGVCRDTRRGRRRTAEARRLPTPSPGPSRGTVRSASAPTPPPSGPTPSLPVCRRLLFPNRFLLWCRYFSVGSMVSCDVEGKEVCLTEILFSKLEDF